MLGLPPTGQGQQQSGRQKQERIVTDQLLRQTPAQHSAIDLGEKNKARRIDAKNPAKILLGNPIEFNQHKG